MQVFMHMMSHAFHSLISKATKITNSFATTTDHILTNESNLKVNPAVLQSSITDHNAVFVQFPN